jgi:hypothetical protein
MNDDYNIVNVINELFQKNYIVKLSLINEKIHANLNEIIIYCHTHNVKIIYLTRENIINRTISKCVAVKLNNYFIKTHEDAIEIDEEFFINEYNNHNKYTKMLEIILKEYKHVKITYEVFYKNKNVDDLLKFLKYL